LGRGSEQGDAAFAAAGRALAEHLHAEVEELERTINTRIEAIADPGQVNDPEYGYRLREAIAEGIRFGIEVIERDEDRVQIPVLLLAQAKLAARCGVDIQVVLMRYVAGHTILVDAFHQAVIDIRLPDPFRHRLLRQQGGAFDRLLSAVREAYEYEKRSMIGDVGARQARQVERLLRGEPIDTSSIDYDFTGHHLALIASGADAGATARRLADKISGRCFMVRPESSATLWAWIGRRESVASADLDRIVAELPDFNGSAAIGEIGQGLEGWRFTHSQARAGYRVALHRPSRLRRYSAIAMASAVASDQVLRRSLQQL
jgi:hypothetical protein